MVDTYEDTTSPSGLEKYIVAYWNRSSLSVTPYRNDIKGWPVSSPSQVDVVIEDGIT